MVIFIMYYGFRMMCAVVSMLSAEGLCHGVHVYLNE
jgi:hypothetical protein